MKRGFRKEAIITYAFVFLFVGIAIGGLYFLNNSFTGYAVFNQGDTVEFDEGTYFNTEYSSGVKLQSGQTSGSYISKVFDSGGDAGAKWNSLTFTSSEPTFDSLFCVDGGGDVYQSIDSGINWEQLVDNYGRTTVTSDMFSNSNYLSILAGSSYELYQSSDGTSWSIVNDSFTNKALYIGDVNSDGDLYVATSSGEVWKSDNNGITWNLQGDLNGGATNDPKGLVLTSSGDLFAVDGVGDVYKSINDGEDWTKVNDGYGGSTGTDGMEIDSNNNLYILINTELYKSIDGGINWSIINEDISSYANTLVEIFIDSDDNLFVLDAIGRVFKSIDLGVNWSEIGDCNNGATSDPKGISSFSQTSNLSFYVRSCNESDCADGVWENVSLDNINLDSRYFQYNVTFSSPDSSVTPVLNEVEVDYILADSNSPEISFSSETIEEGDYSNVDSINVGISVSDESDIYSFINFNDSLIGFWKMNDSNEIAKDYSINGYDGTINGAISTSGKFGNSLYFDGVNDYVNIPRSSFDFPLAPFTISFWGKENSGALDNQIILGTYYSKEIIISGKISGILRFWSGGYNGLVSSNKAPNEWHHITMTIDSDGDRNIYIDNFKYPKGIKALPIAGTQDFQIGSGGGYSSSFFNGSLDEVLIFNRVLSEGEVSSLYSASDYSRNFTDLGGGNYSFYAYSQDVIGNEAQTATRNVILSENAPPTLNLVMPIEGSYYGYNESLSLEFSVSDMDNNLDSCWYVLNSNDLVVLEDCQNTSFDAIEGLNLLSIYANDSEGEISQKGATFNIQLGAPEIVLNSPVDIYSLNHEIVFSYLPSDVDLDSCELWGDFNGNFSLNQTDTNLTNNVNNTFSLILDDGIYLWNIKCNDSVGNSEFSENKTFIIDSINPEVSLSQPVGDKTSRTDISISFILNETNQDSCWYNVYRGDSVEIGNTTISCSSLNSSFSVTLDADFILNFYVNDSAGNLGSTSSNFTISTSSGTVIVSGGGGGGGSTTIIQESNSSLEITSDDIGSIVGDAGESKNFKWGVRNSGTAFLNDCKFSSYGDYSSWISGEELRNLAAGERYDFNFEVNIPENTPGGVYLLGVSLDCQEISESSSFNVEILEKKLNFELLSIKRVSKDQIKIIYNLEELSGINQNIGLQFLLFNSDNEKVLEVNENQELSANEKKEFENVIEVDKSLEGELKLLVNMNSEEYSSFVQENILLSRATGFAIFGDMESRDGILSVMAILIFGIFAFFMIKNILKHKKQIKHKKVTKNKKIIKSKRKK